MPPSHHQDPHSLSDEHRKDNEAEQEREGRCRAQQGAVEERMQEHQHEQGIVQALEALPSPGPELSEGEVAGDGKQSRHDHQCGESGPVSEAEAVEPRTAARRDEVVEEIRESPATVHLQSDDHVDQAGDGCPRPHIAPEMVRDGIPSAEQEIGRTDEKRQREKPGGRVARGKGELARDRAMSHLVATGRDGRVMGVAVIRRFPVSLR